MKRKRRYIALLVTLVALLALMLALPTMAVAKDGGNGNHGAVWALDVPMHNLDSGSEWGAQVSDWASMTEHKGGVSEGVHEAKENGWNK